MSREIIRAAFERESKRLTDYANRAESIFHVNAYLKQFKWAFVHPYLQGFHIEYFEKMMIEQSGSANSIFDVFVKKFYCLDETAYYIDAYFKERPSLQPFCLLIDQSVVLCLQRDFAGAINILIPVIEGSIRHYLVNYENKVPEKVLNREELVKIFTLMQERIRKSQMEYYEKHYYEFLNRDIRFTRQQAQLLTNKSVLFYECWFKIIKDFFSNNLYLDNRDGAVTDKLNRHNIFHGFNTNIYYSLENYLRLFNCLHFLSWAFSVATPGVKLLPTKEDSEILFKWKEFEKIKIVGDYMTASKEMLYNQYQEYNDLEVSYPIPPSKLVQAFPRMDNMKLERKLKYLDRLFEQIENKSVRERASV